MIDNITQGNTVTDLSLLYELSLSIGSSLDLTSNCSVFLKTLLARKNLAFASVWIKNRYLPGKESRTGASLVYAHPDYRIKEEHLSLNHPIFRSLRKKKSLSLTSSDTGYQKLVNEKGIRRGTFALFALGDIGVLKIFSSIRKERFGKKELLQLEKVISKFSVSLEGCLAYRNSLREISERRQAEAALRESEKRFKEIAENAQEWIWEMDATGLYTYASPMVKKILGYKPEEIVGKKHYYDVFHPDHRSRLKKEASAVFARKQPFLEFPNRNAHKNGRTVWLSTSGVPLIDANGDLIGYRGADTDITLKKQREEQLRFQSSIAEQSTEGIAIVDLAGKLVFVNRAFSAMHGFQPEKLLGKHLSVFHTSDQIPAVKVANKKLRETGEFIGEIQHTRRDGTEFPALMHNSLLRDESGTPIGMIGTCRDITERKQAQAALQASEARYRSLFEDSPISLWEEDFSGVKIYLEGLWKKKPANFRRYFEKNPEVVAECAKKVKIVDVNQATLNLYKANNVTDFRRGLSKVFTGESFEAYKEELITLAEGKTRFETETLNRTMEGEEKYIRITVSLPPDYSKTWSKILVSIVDITERKMAEEALRESEERFRVLADKSPNMIFVNQAGRVVYANKRCEELMGYSQADFYARGFNFQTLIAPEYHRIVESAFKEHQVGKEVEPYEYALITRSGNRIESIIATKLIHYRGMPAIMGIITDITTLKRAEAELRESEEKYRIFVERANDGILIIQDGIVKYANPRMGEMSGYSVDKLIDSPFTDYVHSDEIPNVVEHYRRRLAGEDVEPVYETVLKRGDGIDINAEVNAGIIMYQGARADLVFIRDITERKKMAEELIKASKLESLGIMAGGIAHDFNNVLTGILGNISLARLESGADCKGADRLAAAEKATLRAKNLTQQLLTFSKGGKPVKIATSVSDFLKETVDFALSGSNIAYKLILPDNLQPIAADIGQIRQVIDNLIINAVHAMPEGGTIVIDAQNFIISKSSHLPLKKGKYVKLSVRDAGIGIKAEHLPKVFDPFFTTKQKGSGLGLTSAYSIVKNHDGIITVDSQLYRGTTFTIYLPASTMPVTKEDKTGKREYSPRTGRVLIVDDEEVIRDVAERIVKLLGYQPEVADGGKKGIELYEAALKKGRPFDAVLLDLTMPGGMGGKAVAAKIRALDRNAKIVASSGYSTDPIMSNFNKFGFDAALTKPYRIDELSDVLDRVIRGKT